MKHLELVLVHYMKLCNIKLLLQLIINDQVDGKVCVTKTSKPGSRCIKPLSVDPVDLTSVQPDNTMCVEMSCSFGEVLINGSPCNPGAKPPSPPLKPTSKLI